MIIYKSEKPDPLSLALSLKSATSTCDPVRPVNFAHPSWYLGTSVSTGMQHYDVVCPLLWSSFAPRTLTAVPLSPSCASLLFPPEIARPSFSLGGSAQIATCPRVSRSVSGSKMAATQLCSYGSMAACGRLGSRTRRPRVCRWMLHIAYIHIGLCPRATFVRTLTRHLAVHLEENAAAQLLGVYSATISPACSPRRDT